MLIKRKRVYDPVQEGDGLRVLVDKTWPHGIEKGELPFAYWAKELTPSDELRELYQQNNFANWDLFTQKYREELQHSPAISSFVKQVKDTGVMTITLLYSATDDDRNHAVVLQDFLSSYL